MRSLLARAYASMAYRLGALSGLVFKRKTLPSRLVNDAEIRPQIKSSLNYMINKYGKIGLGDYLEFGVYNGASMMIWYQELGRSGVKHNRLIGFDSFAGLPDDNEGFWRRGDFCADYDHVVRRLSRSGIDWGRAMLVKGMFSETLTQEFVDQQGLRHASFIMIDCDLYQSAKEALAFCAPLIREEAILFFDDWNPLAKENKGEKRAFDEFLQANACFEAEEFGEYSWQAGDLFGKVFRVWRKVNS